MRRAALAGILILGFVGSARLDAATDFFGAAPTPADAPASTPVPGGDSVAVGRLVLLQRVMHQDQGDWQVDYTFRNAGAEPLTLHPRDLGARSEGWLSNSRVAAHANPRRAACLIDGQLASTAYAEVIPAAEETRRCRERVVFAVSLADAGPTAPAPTPGAPAGSPARPVASRSPLPTATPLTVDPGSTVRVRLRFEHQHLVHGAYDPLLGRRDIELRLGATTFRDALPLVREQYQAMPREGAWPEPPDDRRDRRYAVSGPDSLHLDFDFPGNNYFRFPERKVRYATPMRLRFWYRVAPGTEGELHVQVSQARNSVESFRSLADGAMDIPLVATGHWVRFEKVFRTEAEATELGLAFRITPCDAGEAWIDDVSLEPAAGPAAGP